jgi:tetratricopeptide (TPR) repeat protein
VEHAAQELPEIEDIEPLELEPLSFAEGKVPKPPTAFPPTGLSAGLPAAGPLGAPAAFIDEELNSVLSDIDFQMDYGSPDEAKIEIENALKSYPNHPELLRRLELAEEALRKLGHVHATTENEDGDLSHSFFDLTEVLGDALLETGEGEEMHDATNVVEKIQSVDELFNAFREGVEQQVKMDDYDTHYNLGIAYKEMMLIEPALEEFKKAMRDPERTLECCSMLAICEQSQGNLETAEKWLLEGIQAPGFPPEDSIGLHYDLGELYLQMDRKNEARAQFKIVYDLDPDYREVAQRPR